MNVLPLPSSTAPPDGFGAKASTGLGEWLERIEYVSVHYPDVAQSIKNVPAGWLPHVEAAAQQIAIDYPGAHQTRRILEKHGVLRWYLAFAPDEVAAIVSGACHEATKHCACCGSNGIDVVNQDVWGGWHLTVCNACARAAHADPDTFQVRVYPDLVCSYRLNHHLAKEHQSPA